MPLSWNEIKNRALPAAAAANVENLTRARSGNEQNGKLRAAIETTAQAALDAHAAFPDRAVDAAYIAAEKAAARKPPKLTTDADRVAFLFERYQHLTSLLPVAKPKRARRRSADSAV
jgi:hypothetical protein